MNLTIPLLIAGASMSIISMQAIATSPACSRYQPGHYVRLDDDHVRKLDGQRAMGQIMATDARNLKGFVYAMPWGMIEKTQGVYDFSRIDQALALSKSHGKFFVLKWMDRTFWTGCQSAFIPNYVKRSPPKPDKNGFVDPKWCSANIWETETMDHEIRVLKAIAARYKDDPSFVGINVNDESNITAPGQTTPAQIIQLYEQLRRKNAAIHAVAPKMLLAQGFNWPANGDIRNFDGLVKGLLDMNGGGAVSWPDTIPAKSYWSWYQIARDNKQRLFIFPEFQVSAFYDDATLKTWEGVYKFATQDLGAHGVVWGATNRIEGKWEGIRFFKEVVVPIMNKYPTVTTKGCPWGEVGPTPTAEAWTFCANEWGTCRFSGTAKVRYGANGSYATKTLTNSTPCTNAIFGDPIGGIVKKCEYSPL